jgi:hypothetical protein
MNALQFEMAPAAPVLDVRDLGALAGVPHGAVERLEEQAVAAILAALETAGRKRIAGADVRLESPAAAAIAVDQQIA